MFGITLTDMNTATIICVGYAFVVGLLIGLIIGLTKCGNEMERLIKKHNGISTARRA